MPFATDARNAIRHIPHLSNVPGNLIRFAEAGHSFIRLSKSIDKKCA
jgi:hypothetical protein